MDDNAVTIGLAALVVLGVVAQWAGRRLGFASLLLLLPAGLIAGHYGIVEPEQLLGESLFPLTTMLVALLLFQSGLNLDVKGLPRGVRWPVGRLVTVGALITFVGASLATLALFEIDRGVAFIIGAILVVSGPTVVGPLLEVVRARAAPAAVLQWEGVILDPIGATLGVVVLNVVLAAGRGGVHPVAQMATRVGLGVTVGVLAAAGLVFVMSRYMVTDNMEAAVAVAFAVAAYTVAEVLLSEAGLIAAVALGVIAANQRIVPTARITGFGETLEVLIIGVLFVLLGALVEWEDLLALAWRAAALVAVLVVVLRPLSVAVALAGTSVPWRDRALIGWLDPRGIVAAATATQFSGELTTAGIDAGALPPITFAVILGTGVVYSLTTPAVARALRVAEPSPIGVGLLGHADWLTDLAVRLRDLGATVLLLTSTRTSDQRAVEGVTVVSIHESEDELDKVLDDVSIGQALVATEPGVVRRLIVADLIEALGRRNVYRLRSSRERSAAVLASERSLPRPFSDEVTLTDIEERTQAGATIEVVDGDLPSDALLMAVVHDDGTVDLAPGGRGARRQRRAARAVGSIVLVDRSGPSRPADSDLQA